MKNIIAGIIIGVAATATITAQAQPKGALYPTCGVVTETDETTDTVTFTTDSGNMYVFYGVEDWLEGDKIAAIMDDKGTDQVYDDAVIDVRYMGF